MVDQIANAIELRVEEIAQLFDTLDPFPFRERDLDKDAEEYIVGWARELPRDRPIRIVVHAPHSELHKEHARDLGTALNRYFGYRAEVTALELNELFRIGRQSLAIGLTVLAVCTIAARVAGQLESWPIGRFLEESLIILGWVANWKPIQIFLYDWWPIVRRRNLFHPLAAADVEIKPYEANNTGNVLSPARLRAHQGSD